MPLLCWHGEASYPEGLIFTKRVVVGTVGDLVWMRAEAWGWKDIARRFACDRNTAWRRWLRILKKVADKLSEV